MARLSSKIKDHDFAVTARRVFEQGIGEHLDGTPLAVLLLEKKQELQSDSPPAVDAKPGSRSYRIPIPLMILSAIFCASALV
jgi:hypothetical protein